MESLCSAANAGAGFADRTATVIIMKCDRCESERIASADGKCSDMFGMSIAGKTVVNNNYVPTDYNIGGGDYIRIEYCLDCGQMSGDWPIEAGEIEDDTVYCPECGNEEVTTNLKWDEEEGGEVNQHHCRECDHHWTSW